MALKAGDKIDSFSFNDQNGKEINWPADCQDGKLALFFLRHLGCPLCKEKIDELIESFSLFESKKIRLVVVVQATEKRAETYSRSRHLPFVLVPDKEKKLYDRFEVRRGGLKEFTAPSVLKASLRATFKGHMHGMFEGDEFQVPASFLLSPEGEVVFAYYGKDISDFGRVADLLEKA